MTPRQLDWLDAPAPLAEEERCARCDCDSGPVPTPIGESICPGLRAKFRALYGYDYVERVLQLRGQSATRATSAPSPTLAP